jgi:hypothetical protein
LIPNTAVRGAWKFIRLWILEGNSQALWISQFIIFVGSRLDYAHTNTSSNTFVMRFCRSYRDPASRVTTFNVAVEKA